MEKQKVDPTKVKPVIRTPYNNRYFEKKHEPENLIGKTVPDMSMTIKQILNRHGVGGIFANGKTPIYLGDVELPNIELMEMADIKVLQDQVQERIALRREQEIKQKEEERKRKREEEVDRLATQKVEDYLKKKRFVDPRNVKQEDPVDPNDPNFR